MPTWATVGDVETIAGATVTDADIVRAEHVLDAVTGCGDLKPEQLRKRNLRALKLAAAYQAAWMKGQVDLHTRHDVTSLSTEGGSFATRDELTLLLAPLAKLALKRATWNGPRTAFVTSTNAGRVIDPVISDAHPWQRA